MITSVVPLLLIVVSIVVLAVTGNLFSSSPLVIAAQVAAVGLNLWARSSFQAGTFRVSAAPAGTSIIRRGPYRLIRHPMYAAALLFIWAAVVSHVSALTLTIGIGGAVAPGAVSRLPAVHPVHQGPGAVPGLKRRVPPPAFTIAPGPSV